MAVVVQSRENGWLNDSGFVFCREVAEDKMYTDNQGLGKRLVKNNSVLESGLNREPARSGGRCV